MPITSRFGHTVEGDSPILSLVNRINQAAALKEQSDAANDAAQNSLVKTAVGSFPVIGGLLGSFYGAGETFDQNSNSRTPKPLGGGGSALAAAPGSFGGSGAAIADLNMIAAQGKLQSRLDEAASTQRTAAIMGALGQTGNTIGNIAAGQLGGASAPETAAGPQNADFGAQAGTSTIGPSIQRAALTPVAHAPNTQFPPVTQPQPVQPTGLSTDNRLELIRQNQNQQNSSLYDQAIQLLLTRG